MVEHLVPGTHSVKKLNGAVVSHLIENGVNAVGISPCLNVPGLMTHGGDEYNGVTVLVQSIRETLSAGLVPVIHGDAGLYGTYRDPSARDRFQSMSAGILGGDTLVEIIATHPLIRRNISKAIFLTDVNGVYTKDPKVFQDAVLVKNIFIDPVSGDVMNEVSASGSQHEHDVTGGLEVCAIDTIFCSGSNGTFADKTPIDQVRNLTDFGVAFEIARDVHRRESCVLPRTSPKQGFRSLWQSVARQTCSTPWAPRAWMPVRRTRVGTR